MEFMDIFLEIIINNRREFEKMCKITFFSNLNKKMSKNLDDKNNKVDVKEVNKKDTNTSKKISIYYL